jgi:subtilisin family serine protease
MVKLRVRVTVVLFVAVIVVIGAALPPVTRVAASGVTSSAAGVASYIVVAEDATSLAAASSAVTSAGGTVVDEDVDLGLITAKASSVDFATEADASSAILGVARDQLIGSARSEGRETGSSKPSQEKDDVQVTRGAISSLRRLDQEAEPLADLQWDMTMIDATTFGSYGWQRGSPEVRVGIIDTGVDGTHPDIKPNFSASLSRNFVQDIPAIDGPCEHSSCVDPVDEDDDGHGTHVAGTIGSPINGIGIAGVAPKVTLVNIRAGQDSGYFFLEPTVKALRYAGDSGMNVVNMSFFLDPWLYNCAANPADTPAQQAEQRAVIEAMRRALAYAHDRGVTLVSALGNEHSDLGDPGVDSVSPDYPAGTAHRRTLDNSTCLFLPAEGDNVISVSAVGPSGKKADYSNYGLEQNDLSAPGGFDRDFASDPSLTKRASNLVLAPMPHEAALASGQVDRATGKSTNPLVVASCSASGPDHCVYWQYLQGTSMASPHVAGVAALIVAQYGHQDAGKLTLDPGTVERIMRSSVTHFPCPASVVRYTDEGRDGAFDASCVGTADRNSIYGDGVVNALRAVNGTASRS